MKSHLLAVAVCLTVCAGCQSSNLLSSRLGHGREDELAELAESSNSTKNRPGLPPPTNARTRESDKSLSAVDDHVLRGEAALRDGRNHEAQQHFEQALLIEPEHAKANHRMAVVSDKLGQYDRAERHYQVALDNDPKNVAILSDLGYSYWLQHRYKESERYLLKARSIDPNYETAIANLGMLYGTTGRTDEALTLFRQIGDETQVQEIMEQVAAVAARRETPANSSQAVPSPQIVANGAATGSESGAGSRDLTGVNGPTRELLELMEQGRRQQQLAERTRPSNRQQQPSGSADWDENPIAQAAGSVPPFVRDRQMPAQRPSPQMVGVNPFHDQGQGVRPAGSPQVPDHLLNEALAEIDRQGRPSRSGPITLGPAAPSPQEGSGSYLDASALSQSAQGGMYDTAQPHPQVEASHLASTQTSRGHEVRERLTPPLTNEGPNRNQQPTRPVPPVISPAGATVAESTQAASGRNMSGMASEPAFGLPHPDPAQFAPSQSSGQSHFAAAGDHGVAERFASGNQLTGGIQQASATSPHASLETGGQFAATDQRPVEYAHLQQQAGSTERIDLMHGSTASAAKPAGPVTRNDSSMDLSTNGGPSTASLDPYEQARRQAAILGLGAGPGQLFPYVQQTQRVAPGTDSRWNGAQYPAPQRQLPTAATPADLHAAFAPPQAAVLSPQQTYQGQALPPVSAPINHPARYGAATSGGVNYVQQNPAPPSSTGLSLQSYDDVRQQQSRQLNGLISETYGQSPQSPPYNPHAPQSQLINSPAAPQSGAAVWDLTPPTPPQGSAQTPANRPLAVQPTSGTVSAGYAGGTAPTVSDLSAIVIPEPYPGSAAGTRSQPVYPQQMPTPQYSGSDQVPVIVPKPR